MAQGAEALQAGQARKRRRRAAAQGFVFDQQQGSQAGQVLQASLQLPLKSSRSELLIIVHPMQHLRGRGGKGGAPSGGRHASAATPCRGRRLCMAYNCELLQARLCGASSCANLPRCC